MVAFSFNSPLDVTHPAAILCHRTLCLSFVALVTVTHYVHFYIFVFLWYHFSPTIYRLPEDRDLLCFIHPCTSLPGTCLALHKYLWFEYMNEFTDISSCAASQY